MSRIIFTKSYNYLDRVRKVIRVSRDNQVELVRQGHRWVILIVVETRTLTHFKLSLPLSLSLSLFLSLSDEISCMNELFV